jgi:hypothetical protein
MEAICYYETSVDSPDYTALYLRWYHPSQSSPWVTWNPTFSSELQRLQRKLRRDDFKCHIPTANAGVGVGSCANATASLLRGDACEISQFWCISQAVNQPESWTWRSTLQRLQNRVVSYRFLRFQAQTRISTAVLYSYKLHVTSWFHVDLLRALRSYSCASAWTRLLRRQLRTYTITSSPKTYWILFSTNF